MRRQKRKLSLSDWWGVFNEYVKYKLGRKMILRIIYINGLVTKIHDKFFLRAKWDMQKLIRRSVRKFLEKEDEMRYNNIE